jgi:drug/metabolite transporter (DMT)-like permease
MEGNFPACCHEETRVDAVSTAAAEEIRMKQPASASAFKGIGFMLIGSALLTLSDAIVKWLAAGFPVGQILFVRGCIVALLILLVVIPRPGGLLRLRVMSWRAQSVRALCMIGSTFLFVSGLGLLPLADAIAVSFAGPLFLTLLAIPLLGEQVGWRRWSAVLIGFAGVLIMSRPSGSFDWAILLPLGASLSGALRDIVTRRMGSGESTIATLNFTNTAVIAAGLCTLPFGWQPLQPSDLVLLMATGLLTGGAHFLLIETFRWVEVSLVAPFKYSTLLWGLLLGYLVWGHIPAPTVIAGALLVAGSGLYILHREMRR